MATTTRSHLTNPTFLSQLADRPVRPVIRANAAYCAANGLVALAASGPLSDWLDIDRWILLVIGAGLLGYAPVLAWFASKRPLRRREVLAAFAGDLAWCLGAIALIAWPDLLSTPAKLVLAAISIPVLVFTDLEWMRRDNLE